MKKRKLPRIPIGRPQKEVYTVGHGKGFIYTSLPSPVTTLYSLLVAGSVSGLAYFLGDRFDPSPPGRGGYFWFVATVGTMTALSFLGMYFKGRRVRKQQRQSEEFEGALKDASGGFGDGDDPAEMQRLDDLRANFQKGIDTFREYGKDLYSMPWYVIVGEPGSGKTEAIRHSELKFPETLQDKLQGTGGTYSMHWWFTNHAVILDTAGAMLMNPEAGERFREFLKLLRSWRPECPLNGMLLTIPVDSLLVDDIATSEEKARTISEQLSLIQQSLDIRFPIYLMITKADRLPGFHEFCDAAGQERFDRQMIGWSNPGDLSEPFAPEMLDTALRELAARLRARRLALLNDPVPRNTGARRLDEVDALYTFPDTVASLAPRLKRYLEIILQSGEWTKRPPFFRGLYFTSAMREGSTLDEELASALGMPVNQLPQGGVWSQQKSLYLRDLFMEKIFRERGLVTRLKDIARSLRRRLVWMYGTVGVLLAMLLGGAYFVKRGIERDIADDRRFWDAADGRWDNGRFLPLLERTAPTAVGLPRWEWAGGSSTLRDGTSRLQVLEYVEARSAAGISGGWVFRPLNRFRDMERERRVAYRTLFEGSVVKPLLDAARESILLSADLVKRQDGQADAGFARALAGLVELEAAVGDSSAEPFDEAQFTGIFRPLLSLARAGDPAALDQEFEAILSLARKTYGKDFPFWSRGWMREDLSVAGIPADRAEAARPIAAGWDLFAGSSEAVAQDAGQLKALNDRLFTTARRFRDAEDALAAMATGRERQFIRIDNALNDLRTSSAEIATLDQERSGMKVRLPENLYTEVKGRITAAVDKAGSRSPLLTRLRGRLSSLGRNSDDAGGETDEQRDLTANFLTGGAAGQRLAVYEQSLLFADKLDVFRPGSLRTVVERLEELAAQPPAPAADPPATSEDGQPTAAPGEYAGPRADIARKVAAVLRGYAPQFALRTICGNYRRQAVPVFDRALRFPFVLASEPMTSAEFLTECERLQPIRRDRDFFLAEGSAARFPECAEKTDLQQLFGRMADLVRIMDALYDPEKKALRKLKVQLDASSSAKPPKEIQPPPLPPDDPQDPRFPPRRPFQPEPEVILDHDVTSVILMAGILPGPPSTLYTGPPGASSTLIPTEIDVNQGFSINVLGNIRNFADQSYLRDGRPEQHLEEWGILRWLLAGKRVVNSQDQRITVYLAHARPPRNYSFTVTFQSPLPAADNWPLRRDFIPPPAENPAANGR